MQHLMIAGLTVGALAASIAAAQTPPPSYGEPISLENAKKAAGPATAEARKNGWLMAIAVVDPSGNLVYFEKMDGTQTGSVPIAIDKARSAALFKRPTKAFQDTLAAGGDGLRILKLQGAMPVEGGVPIVVEGRIVGAIGVSGGTSQQDGVCAAAGAAAIAESRKNNWTMAVAVTDIGGDLVYFEKMDGTMTGSVAVAIAKARSAALFKRPTKAFQDTVAGGGAGLRILGLEGAVPIEGGLPILLEGKIIGSIGLSGGSSEQDGIAAKAGVDAVK